MRGWTNHPRAWLVIGLGLAMYVVASSVLGLIIPLILTSIGAITPSGPVAAFLAVWSNNVGADVAFVAGSIASAVVGVLVAKTSTIRSIALAAVLTALTYMIAAGFGLQSPIGMPGEGGPPPPGAPNFNGIAILVTPLVGIVGVVFAAVAPAIARRSLAHFLFTH